LTFSETTQLWASEKLASQADVHFAMCGIGAANLVPIPFSTAGKQSDLDAGVGMSVATTIGHVGLLLAPSIIGFTAGKFGLASVYITIAFILAATSLMARKTAASPTAS